MNVVSRIKIKRISQIMTWYQNYQILLDDKEISRISKGEEKEFEIEPGKHRLKVKTRTYESKEFEFDIRRNETLGFLCGCVLNGFWHQIVNIYWLFMRDQFLFIEPENSPKFSKTASKPVLVWILSYLIGCILFIWSMIFIMQIGRIYFLDDSFSDTSGLLFMTLVKIAIGLKFAICFFKLKNEAKQWVNIFFATLLGTTILTDVFFKTSEYISISYFWIILIGLAWWFLHRYINKKKLDGKLLFAN